MKGGVHIPSKRNQD